MAKKKQFSGEDALKVFRDIYNRLEVPMVTHENACMIYRNNAGFLTIIIPEINLWNMILEDSRSDNSDKIIMSELSPDNPAHIWWSGYISGAIDNTNWFNINDIDQFFHGKIIDIKINDDSIPITKELLPLKLKKAEFNNIRYKVYTIPHKNTLLYIDKKFSYELSGYGFSVMRMFSVI